MPKTEIPAFYGNVIKLTRKAPPPLGEVARESVTERALGKEFPSQSPHGASSPWGELVITP